MKVWSFDVFDTCLTRKTAVPSGVFFEVAQRVCDKIGVTPSDSVIEDFVTARIKAEKLCRETTSREDVTLQEIWERLLPAMGWRAEPTLRQCELDVEEELLIPVNSIRHEVQAAREKGYRVIFVSDMYLPAPFIERQLVKHGLAIKGDNIYVSGDIGKTKYRGSLFRHILAQERISASEMIHTGDNEHSDFNVPRQLGIPARLFGDAQLTLAETCLLQGSRDIYATSRIVGAMRAHRVNCRAEEEKNINELSSQLAAPFILGFASWVLSCAKESGVKRLYFLSRDCQIVWKVASKLSPQFGEIDCRYLLISRQALFLPSAEEISPRGMPWMGRSMEQPILKNLLAKLELKYADDSSVFGELAGEQGETFCIKSEADWGRFWGLLNRAPVKKQIENLISTRRESARRYFASAGLMEDVPWALVDFGWSLRCQEALRSLLKLWGHHREIQGYYFGLCNQRVGFGSAGMSKALIYQAASDVPTATSSDEIFDYDYIQLLEHVVGSADHPTVHHYEESAQGGTRAVPAGSVDEKTLLFCRRLHDDVLDFVEQNQSLVEIFKDANNCRLTLEILAKKFFKDPTRRAVQAICDLLISTDQNCLDPIPIAKPLCVADLGPSVKSARSSFNSGKRICFWFEGAMAITAPSILRKATFSRTIHEYQRQMIRSLHRLTMVLALRTRLRRLAFWKT